MKSVSEQLFELKDDSYKSFQTKLMPNVCPDTVIGVRTPVLRSFATKFSKKEECREFMQSLPHSYYEENNLHAFLTEKIKDYDLCIRELDNFLPYIDNWATCDSLTPKIFKNHKSELLNQIDIWLNSNHPYTIRFAIRMLMVFYLDEDFKTEYSDRVAAVDSDEYYVKMMVAWYFATALAKQYEKVVVYLKNEMLTPWIHNKTIQKSVESFRISNKNKEYLKTLRRNFKTEESPNE